MDSPAKAGSTGNPAPINTIRTWIGGTVATSPAQTHASIGIYTFDGTTYTRVAQTGNVTTLWQDDFSEIDVPLTTEWTGGAEGLEIAVGALHIAASAHPALPDAGGWYARNFAAHPHRLSSYIGSQTGQPATVAASGTGPNSRRYLFGLIDNPAWTAP